MSIHRYERLTAAREQAVASSAASMQMAGMTATEAELAAAGELVAGRIDYEEYTRRIDAQ